MTFPSPRLVALLRLKRSVSYIIILLLLFIIYIIYENLKLLSSALAVSKARKPNLSQLPYGWIIAFSKATSAK